MPADPKKPPPKKDAAALAATASDGDRPTPDASKLSGAEEGPAAPAADLALLPPAAPAAPDPLPEAPKPPAPAPPAPKPQGGYALYRVWPHGSLQRNERTYLPGETLTLSESEGSTIECLAKVAQE